MHTTPITNKLNEVSLVQRHRWKYFFLKKIQSSTSPAEKPTLQAQLTFQLGCYSSKSTRGGEEHRPKIHHHSSAPRINQENIKFIKYSNLRYNSKYTSCEDLDLRMLQLFVLAYFVSWVGVLKWSNCQSVIEDSRRFNKSSSWQSGTNHSIHGDLSTFTIFGILNFM